MENLAEKIETTLNEIVLFAGNHNEILIGECHCNHDFTNTQKHILMLLKKENYSNKDLATKLNISQPAVTKAIKMLIKENMLLVEKDSNDGRILRYTLSDVALHIANEHENHHNRTLISYKNILENYSEADRLVINKFLDELIDKVRGR